MPSTCFRTHTYGNFSLTTFILYNEHTDYDRLVPGINLFRFHISCAVQQHVCDVCSSLLHFSWIAVGGISPWFEFLSRGGAKLVERYTINTSGEHIFERQGLAKPILRKFNVGNFTTRLC